MRRATGLCLLAVSALCDRDAIAQGTHRVRRRFEPTDLDLRGRGAAEINLQSGVIEGASSTRTLAPDVEAVLGLNPNAQLQIDTTMGFDDSYGSKLRFLENTWTSLKLGIFDHDDGDGTAWAGGIQAGPKLPTTTWSHGIGAEALAIVGRSAGALHVFVQAGVLLDPFAVVPNAPDVRPFAAEGGVDLDLDLDTRELWSFKAELGGARFFSLRTTEAHLTAGLAYRVVPWLELSAIGITGVGPGDRLGVLFGAAPRFDLF